MKRPTIRSVEYKVDTGAAKIEGDFGGPMDVAFSCYLHKSVPRDKIILDKIIELVSDSVVRSIKDD